MTTDLHIVDIHKRFRSTTVLDGVDLDVSAGTITAILGTSGSGKTTLLRIIAGFERADRGAILVGESILEDRRHHVPVARRRVSYVAQEGNLFPHHDVAANIGFGLRRGEQRRDRVAELVALMDLKDLEKRYPHQLSGGQQQRVALARALAVRPDIVLLDEPFASLDARLRSSIRSDVRDALHATGATAILVTHDQSEALAFADRVAVIRGGSIAQYASPAELITSPIDPDLALFLGEATILDGELSGGRVTTPLGQFDVRPPIPTTAMRVSVLVRPDQVVLEVSDSGPVSGTVVRSEFHGTSALTSVKVDGAGQSTVVISRSLSHVQLAAGTIVRVRIHGQVHIWPSPQSDNSSDHSAASATNDLSLD